MLVNYYRNGSDYVGWHADNERELGPEPYIVSLTLGATRTFCYKHKTTHKQGQLLLPSGSLLIMKPDFQHDWLHSVPAESATSTGRINLTYRYVVIPTSS